MILDGVSVGAAPYPNRVVGIQRCAKVYLRESTLDAGEDPILIEDSHVICEGSFLVSGRWTFFGDPPPLETLQLGPGADVTLIRSQVIGTGVSIQRAQTALLMAGDTIRVDAASTLAANTGSPVTRGASGAIWLDPGAFLQGVRSSIQPWGYTLWQRLR